MGAAEQMTDAHAKALVVGVARSYEKIAMWVKERALNSRQGDNSPLPAACVSEYEPNRRR
jgi:hypothetical protein